MTSRLGMGMSLTFFYGVQWVKNGARNRVKRMGSGRGARRSKLFLPYELAVFVERDNKHAGTKGKLEHPESRKTGKLERQGKTE